MNSLVQGGSRRDPNVPIFGLFFLSGIAGLIYESVWSHYVKLFLGHAAYAQTLVLVVFIGGLALGSAICARRAERIRNPLRAYALVEGAIGLMALVFHGAFLKLVDWGYASLLPATCDAGTTVCVSQWLLSAAMIAPQSVLLGATFPLISSAVLRNASGHPGHDIASLYFINSMGAVLGVLTSAFILIPAVGLPGTLMTAGIANVMVAIAAWFLAKRAPERLDLEPVAEAGGAEGMDDRTLGRILLLTAMLTGMSSFIYEIAWIRMLSLVLGASTNSFELMLASFILGLALGGLWIRNRVDVGAEAVRLLAYVQLAMGIFAIATILVYNVSFDAMAWLLSALSQNEAGFVIFNVASTVICLAVMLPATFCAGMTLPLITYRLLRSRSGERALGAVYAVNTLGSILGVIVAVHVLLVWLGVDGALIVGGAIDVVLGVYLLWRHRGARPGPRVPIPAAIAVVVFGVFAMMADIDPLRSASGVFRTGSARLGGNAQVLFHRDGKTATVDVVANGDVRAIRTNGKPDAALSMGDGNPVGDEFTMAMLAILPLGHQPEARTAAVIGFGSGMSSAIMLASEKLERLDTIEIEPAMVEGARHFFPLVEPAYTDPRSHIIIDDAKSFFARGRHRYDIIVSEPSNPWVSGVASLFTQEFYARLGEYLNDGGVLAQWLHTYEMDAPTLASILAAFERSFPDYVVYMPNFGDVVLIARKGGKPGSFDPSVLKLPKLQPTLQKLQLTDPALMGRRIVASSDLLRPYFASYRMPPNSDFFPIVDHRASKTRFTKAQVGDLSAFHQAGLPFLEMLDGRFTPAPRPSSSRMMTASEIGADAAWRMHAAVLRGVAQANPNANPAHESTALVMRHWATGCSGEWPWSRVLPTAVALARGTNPHLPAEAASEIWAWLAGSPCARKVELPERHWLDLFAAVAARDGGKMATVGANLLKTSEEQSEAMEYALFATVTGLICTGRAQEAEALLKQATSRWVRAGQNWSEVRLLDAIASNPQAAQAAARCR